MALISNLLCIRETTESPSPNVVQSQELEVPHGPYLNDTELIEWHTADAQCRQDTLHKLKQYQPPCDLKVVRKQDRELF